jgi:molecular chaperone DnaJ
MPTVAQRDYYEVLGVARDADDKTIKDAFRRLALRYHPDRSTEPDAEERFKEIAEAYAVLSDPRKRADYDARGFPGVAGISAEDLWANVDLGDIFGGLGFDFGGGLFERLFGRPGRRGPPRGADIEVSLAIPLATVASGGDETVTIDRPGPCGTCGGSGARPGTTPEPCAACGGSGQHTSSSRQGNVVIQHVTTCTTCAGRGTVIRDPCPDCGGRGRITQHDRLTVQIPAGIEDGTALRVPGQGLPHAGRPGRGDLVVTVAVHIPDHPTDDERGLYEQLAALASHG